VTSHLELAEKRQALFVALRDAKPSARFRAANRIDLNGAA
jgi:hypothetical protein